jgi:PAS domain S-box-containing protein
MNKAGEELLGVKRNDLFGKNDFDFFSAQEANFFIEKDREVLSHSKLLDIPEEQIETKSKGKRWLHTKKIPLMDSNGKPEYLLGISEDITDRLQIDKVKSDFITLASHQLRTPLTEIRWALSSLKKQRLGKDQKHVVESAHKAVLYH